MLPKDVLTDLSVAPDIKLPFTFNELIQYHNRSQFIEAKFKTAAQIPVNWNKRNIVLSWLIIHSWNILADDKSRQILMQTIDSKVLHNDNDDAGIRLKGSVKHNLREIEPLAIEKQQIYRYNKNRCGKHYSGRVNTAEICRRINRHWALSIMPFDRKMAQHGEHTRLPELERRLKL